MSHEFLRNIVRCPCSPVSYTSDTNEAVDMSELSKQLEKIRLNCMQQKANVSSDKPQPGYYDNYKPGVCGLFDKLSADDEDDMFSWQGKAESNERDDDDSINFSELFRDLGSRKMNNSSPQSSRCQMEVKVQEASTEEEVVVIGSDTEEKDDAAVMSTEIISSITTSFSTERAEASSLSSACALPHQKEECNGDQKTTKLVTMGFMGNKEKKASTHAFKASAEHKRSFKRAGKRRPEYHSQLQRVRVSLYLYLYMIDFKDIFVFFFFITLSNVR